MQNNLLAAIAFDRMHQRSEDPTRLTLGLPDLAASGPIETWEVQGPVDCGWDEDIGFVESHDLIFVHLLRAEPDHGHLARITRDLYRDLLVLLERRGFRHLLRVWNFMEAINDRANGVERYQSFSLGRARAFDRAGLAGARIPAASAIGSPAPGLMVYALASRRAGLAVENPRQTPAYRYPQRYGPRPPYFARATWASFAPGRTLFISGTASVVGHRSQHPGQPLAQLEETLHNLDSLMRAAGTAPGHSPKLLKVYLRPSCDIDPIDARLRAWTGPQTAILYLRGDICRGDLELEIEGVLRT